MLYHLSHDPYLTHLSPRVSTKANATSEDNTTPRISVAPTIDGCLRALCVTPENVSTRVRESTTRGNTSEFFDRRFNVEVEEKMKLLNMSYEDMEAENLRTIMTPESSNVVPALPFPVYYVYAPVGKDIMRKMRFITPEDVYDANETGEVWLMDTVQVVKIGCIYVRYSEWVGMYNRTRYNPQTHKKRKRPEHILIQTYNYISAPPLWISKSLDLWTEANKTMDIKKKKEQLASKKSDN